MPVRYHAQRQHIVRSLDQILYQLHTVSFFLSPSLLPYLSRVLFQFQFAKPREVDPERSLRFWFFLVCVFNLGSVWTHATESPAQTGNSILLDFVGPAAIPSRLQLLLLDLAIILLDMLLAAISYEAALYESSPKDSPDPLLPIPPQTSPSPTPLPSTPSPSPPQSPSSSPTMLPTYAYPPKPPSATGVQTPYVMDVHLNMIYRRLRDPAPPAPERDARIEAEDLLPLPNTTPSDITGTMRLILRARLRARERQRRENERREERRERRSRRGTESSTRNQEGRMQRIPGGLDTDDGDDEGES